ncbi:TonB-dependent receptor [Burkholderia plantarii]|uniref:TonB-dependent receptor n=1 Tax=Burkholderia plantarii TaxID=41899 RepID=UPI001F5BF9E5|nr:TonB-dependent receptor [Burkholderia plantarii]
MFVISRPDEPRRTDAPSRATLPDAQSTLHLPSWTRYDAGLRYRTRIAGKSVVFRANLENVLGKRYRGTQNTYLMDAAPRTVLLCAQIGS